MQRWMEELFDTIFYVVIVTGLMIFFTCYWKWNYEQRCAEIIIQEFLDEVSAEGCISSEKYEWMLQNVERINASYKIEIVYTNHLMQPIFAQISEAELVQYYVERNIRKNKLFREYGLDIEEASPELLQLQKETNASILAAEKESYIPLPDDGGLLQVEAVRAFQEVYEGEMLITLCRVYSGIESYYIEAESCYGEKSGIVNLQILINGEVHSVPIEVICYPRTVFCENGHKVVNSEEILRKSLSDGDMECPYCKVLPKEIICNVSTLTRKTGETLSEEEIWAEVLYLDGTQEVITPESKEWQDNYDENYCGIQPVVIKYRGVETSVIIISANSTCKQCGAGCNERSFVDYEIFPYCTKCMSEVLLFTGKTVEEEQRIQGEQLLAQLNQEKRVLMEYGDFVTVYISKNNRICSVLQKEVKQNGR